MFVSDDKGRTWQRSNVLDYGVGHHDHAGSIEGTVIERKDGSLYLLLRTESGWLYEATSRDGGLKWEDLKQSQIKSVTCCAQMARLADGRIALLWNHPPRHLPGQRHEPRGVVHRLLFGRVRHLDTAEGRRRELRPRRPRFVSVSLRAQAGRAVDHHDAGRPAHEDQHRRHRQRRRSRFTNRRPLPRRSPAASSCSAIPPRRSAAARWTRCMRSACRNRCRASDRASPSTTPASAATRRATPGSASSATCCNTSRGSSSCSSASMTPPWMSGRIRPPPGRACRWPNTRPISAR